MDFKVLYTKPALADLQDILAWSWGRHPGTTEQFANALLNHVDFLAGFPNMGAPVEGHPDVRCLLHSPLQVFYRVHEGRRVIEVLHFWHGARHGPKF